MSASDLPAQLNIPTPPAMAKALEDGMLAKAQNPYWKIFWLGLTGGAYIAFGFTLYVTSQMGAAGGALPLGVMKVIGGLVFSAGLIMVINSGSDLFTGTTMTVMPLASGRLAAGRFGMHWLLSYVANLIGSVAVAVLLLLAGTYASNKGAWGIVVLNITNGKLSYDWGQAFLLGILANTLVCIAVWLTFAGRSFIDKVLAVIVPIVVFVASGFEHSVANMFMLPMGWLIKTFGSDTFWASDAVTKAGVTPADFDGITLGAIVWNNIIPVTLGNIVGGAILVGMYFWVAYRKDAVKAEREAATAAR